MIKTGKSFISTAFISTRGLIAIVMGAVFLFTAPLAFAQSGRMSLLLDAEVDDYMNSLAAPLLEQAGLSPDNVHILVLDSPTINAFVNSQRAVFMMSGLILEAQNANEVQGVIAHEIGHLKGHHILRLNEAQSSLTLPTIVGGLLGLGAIVAGAPQAGSAVLLGSQAAGISSLLRFSRSQEQQADQIAVNLLQETNLSTEGLKNFFGRLSVQSQMYHKTPPEYLMTHPKPSGRESFLENVETQPYSTTPQGHRAFERVQAKVMALSFTPSKTRRLLFDKDTAIADYARAVAFVKAGQLDEATRSAKQAQGKLGAENDPYFLELYGHIALEKGNLGEAELKFASALEQKPDSTLIRYHYGRSLLLNEKNKPAIAQLERVLQKHGQWWMAHQQIALAYGKIGQEVSSHIHLAQAALYQGNYTDTGFHLTIAEKKLAPDETPEAAQQRQTIKILKQELEKLRN